jgi:hypothetical protein
MMPEVKRVLPPIRGFLGPVYTIPAFEASEYYEKDKRHYGYSGYSYALEDGLW